MINPNLLVAIQMTMMAIVYGMLVGWVLFPRLQSLPLEKALLPFIYFQAFRVIGGAILAPGAVDPAVPDQFRAAIGYGDLITALLAIIAVVMIRYKIAGAIPVVWIFAIFGTLDLINAAIQGARLGIFDLPLGFSWTILTMYVPALWVTAIAIFYLLLVRQNR